MNRISRRSAAEAAEGLLEAGRTQPVLDYDVELGLARHHAWVLSDAPLPDWASASLNSAVTSWLPLVIKSIVSGVLLGAIAIATWYGLASPPPSAAVVKQTSAGTVPALAPSVPQITAPELSLALTPMPISDHGHPSDPPTRRTVRADAPDKHTTRSQRAHKAARAVSERAEPPVAQATAARVEPAAVPATENESVEQAPRNEVAAASARKPISAAHRARPEPAPQAQAPDDLEEMQQVATAEQLLEGSPERALALVRKGDQRFARGYFQQERAYIAIMALIRLGRVEEARTRAASFAKHFPALPYGARIRSALEAHVATP